MPPTFAKESHKPKQAQAKICKEWGRHAPDGDKTRSAPSPIGSTFGTHIVSFAWHYAFAWPSIRTFLMFQRLPMWHPLFKNFNAMLPALFPTLFISSQYFFFQYIPPLLSMCISKRAAIATFLSTINAPKLSGWERRRKGDEVEIWLAYIYWVVEQPHLKSTIQIGRK